jgi:hypothetical protein
MRYFKQNFCTLHKRDIRTLLEDFNFIEKSESLRLGHEYEASDFHANILNILHCSLNEFQYIRNSAINSPDHLRTGIMMLSRTLVSHIRAFWILAREREASPF